MYLVVLFFLSSFLAVNPSLLAATSNSTGLPLNQAQCVYDSDCANDLVCKWGQCVSVCKNAKDCREGEFCARKYKFGEKVPELFSATQCVKKNNGPYQDLGISSYESFQYGSAAWGKALREFPLKEENPALCYKTCKEDPACGAWSYSKSGQSAEAPYCFHKAKADQILQADGYISGLVERR